MITYNEYVSYHTLNNREEVLAWIKKDNTIYSNNDNYLSIVEHLLNHKEQTKRDYQPRGNKRSYNNIYAHRIEVMLPKSITNNELADYISTYMSAIDSLYKSNRYLYMYRTYKQGTGLYADIVCFTRKFYKRKQKKLIVWDQDYYWNPVTKKRCKKDHPDAVLLHKKDDLKLDSNGNKQYTSYYVSLKESQIFKYKSFKRFINRLKKAIKYTKQLLYRDYYNSQIKYFSYITIDKNISILKKRKIEIKNNLIKRINISIYKYQTDLINGYFYDEVEKEFHKVIFKIDKLLHDTTIKDTDTNSNVYLGFKQSFASLNNNIDILEENINYLLNNWWENHVYIPYFHEITRGDKYVLSN